MVGVLFVGCANEPERIIFNGPHIVSFSRANVVVNENAASGTATLVMSRTFLNDVTVSFDITAENAIEGIDYSVSENSVVIPAGEYEGTFTIMPINNEVFDAARRVNVTITGISEEGLTPSAENQVTISILNDDCPVKTSIWAGESSSTEFYLDGSDPYGPFSVALAPNEAGDCDVLEISNIGDFGGDHPVTMTFTPTGEGATTGTVEISRQGIGTYGSTGERTVEGSGTYDETSKVIEIYLTFKFGDGSFYYDTNTEFYGN